MLKFGNTYLNFGGNYLSGFKVPTYNVILQQSEGGIIGATPLTGSKNTEVTLSNTPSQDYVFNGYEISGANLYDTNKFKFVDCDVTAIGNWTYVDPYNPYNLPPFTIRVRTTNGLPPYNYEYYNPTYDARLVEGTSDVYDVYLTGGSYYGAANENLDRAFYRSSNICEVIAANVSGVSSMKAMFHSCYALSSVCLFDTSNVTSFSCMFDNCSGLSSVPKYDTSKATNLNLMFADCSHITDIPSFNTSGVTSTSGMFYNCLRITELPYLDTSKVTDMGNMFQGCRSITEVPLYDTSNVTFMKKIFQSCYSLTSAPNFDTSKVANMDNMFYECSGLSSIPQYDTNSLTSMEYICLNCVNLTSIPFFDTKRVQYLDYAFENCYRVNQGIFALYNYTTAHGMPNPSHQGTFRKCGISSTSGAAELAQIPSNWK